MVFLHSSIFYFDQKAFFFALWANLKRLRFSLIIGSLLAILVLGILNLLIIIFRLLDEIIFFGYRKTTIVKPIFIISNPRSGTTYLHRLMTLDKERYAYFLLYNTIGNSILFNKLIKIGGEIDRLIGRPFRKFFDWTEKKLFSGWKNIHPMGWNESEEDEAPFVFSFSSPATAMILPYLKTYDWVNFPDKYPPKKGKKLMRFYKNSLQRFMYSEGKGKTLLDKNVFSTGRVKLILDCFPDARIIYPVRHPYETVPSLISMFSKPWKFLYRFIPENSDEYRQWGFLAIHYYQYFYMVSKAFSPAQFYTFSYNDLIEEPEELINKIYYHFDLDKNTDFTKLLKEKTEHNKNYKSKHTYSLELYGLSKKMVYEELKPVFKKYNFKQ